MLNVAQSEAMVEVLEILSQMEKEKVNKIPKKFITFLEDNASKTYKCKLDRSIPLKNQKLKKETKAFLALIYLNYWCKSEDEKNEYIETLKKNEREYQKELSEKYNIDNLFKKEEKTKKQVIEQEQNTQLVVKKKGIMSMFISKIRNYFFKGNDN